MSDKNRGKNAILIVEISNRSNCLGLFGPGYICFCFVYSKRNARLFCEKRFTRHFQKVRDRALMCEYPNAERKDWKIFPRKFENGRKIARL